MNTIYKVGGTLVLLSLILAVIIKFQAPQETRSKTDESVLLVGTAAEFPPFEFIQNGEIVGFDIDLAREVAQRLGKKIEITDMPFTTLIPQIQRGSLHMISAGLTPTPERSQEMLFAKPHLQSDPLIIVTLAKNPPITDIDELKDKKVIVNEGFSAERYMTNEKPDIELVRLATVADAFLSLKSERADAFIVAANSLKPFFKQYPADNFSLYTIPNTNEEMALALSKQYPELLEQVQHVLDQLEEEGVIENLKAKWDVS